MDDSLSNQGLQKVKVCNHHNWIIIPAMIGFQSRISCVILISHGFDGFEHGISSGIHRSQGNFEGSWGLNPTVFPPFDKGFKIVKIGLLVI